MTPPSRITARIWVLIPVCALGLLIWINQARIKRIQYVSAQASWSVSPPMVDRASPTGYGGGVRQMLVPERNADSQQWLIQTQEALRTGEWQPRQVEYDNAPFGRDTYLTSLYRQWLGLLARIDHAFSDSPDGLAVETAALFSGPALQTLLLLVTIPCLARWFGAMSASMFAIGLTFLFPLGGQFLPGVPDHRSMAGIFILWSVLPLLAGLAGKRSSGIEADSGAPRLGPARCWFFTAGVMGGLGIWISPGGQLPILGGIFLGALFAGWLTRKATSTESLSVAQPSLWRIWSTGGACTVLIGYGIEYFPLGTELRLATIHPLYGLGWIAAGELLAQCLTHMQSAKLNRNVRSLAIGVIALGVIIYIANQIISSGALAFDAFASRLSNLPGTAVAQNLTSWMQQDGAASPLFPTLLPLLLVIPSLVFLFNSKLPPTWRVSLAIALGPVLVALSIAGFHLRWWSTFDITLLALLAVTVASHRIIHPRGYRWLWPALALFALLPGWFLLQPLRQPGDPSQLSESEVQSLIDRDLAHWLTKHSSTRSPIALASPDLTAALCYYGNIRGLASFSPENMNGVTAAIRIASATTEDEALALIKQRGVSYLIIPSWDVFLDQYARMGSNMPDSVFIASLHKWKLPAWLRPITYYLPNIAGYENQTVVVLQVIAEPDVVTALSQHVDYFIENGQLPLAVATGEKLKRYPADLRALVALAQIEFASGNHEGFSTYLNRIAAYTSRGAARKLDWERRLRLAITLAQGRKTELAGEQTKLCLVETDRTRLASLSADSLLRLLTLKKLVGLEFSNPDLQQTAVDLLPPSLRKRL